MRRYRFKGIDVAKPVNPEIAAIRPFPEKKYCHVVMMNIRICRMTTCKDFNKCHNE